MIRSFFFIGLFFACSLAAGRSSHPSSLPASASDTATFYLVYSDSVTGNSAKLVADFSTSGLPTGCYFEWGTTTSYGHQSPAVFFNVPAGWEQHTECFMTELKPNTLYHFRAVAQDSISTVFSSDHVLFTTSANLTTLQADSVTTISAVLRTLCDAEGLRLKVFFQYGIDPFTLELQSPFVIVSDSTTIAEVSMTAPDLFPNTTYYYVPVAVGVDYPTVYLRGSTQSFTTLADPYVRGFVARLELKNRNGQVLSGPRLFGIHTHATYCKDIALGEHEIPPYPPVGTPEIRFIDPHGFSNCMGLGLYWDLRHYFGPSQVDTYMVHIQPDNAGYPVILSWSDLNDYYSGPVKLLDPFTGAILNTDMKAQTSDTIGILLDQLLIVAQGPINLVASKVNTISENGVSLDGSFNPNGVSTYGWFEWGDSTAYGLVTPTTDLGSGTKPVEFEHALTALKPNSTYHFRPVIQNSRGNIYGSDQTFTTIATTGVGGHGRLPEAFALRQNYPNPFNPSTLIQYDLPSSSYVTLKLYDVLGRGVRTLVDEAQTPGTHSIRVDATDLGNGVYFCRMRAGTFAETLKLIVLK